MRKLARWGAFVSLGASGVTYVLAKRDFFVRSDEVGTSAYLAGHWPYWAAMVVFAALAAALFWAAGDPVVKSEQDAGEMPRPTE